MLKISSNKDNIIIKKEDNKGLSFSISNKKLFRVISLNIKRLGGESEFFVEKISEKEIYLILKNNHKLLIDQLTAYEISSRMLLLNKNISFPEKIFSSEEESGQEE